MYPGRTTAAKVQGVIETVLTTDLTPFIDFANELVTEKCISSGYSDYRLQMIETWLAAHCYTVLDPRNAREAISGAITEVKQNKVDLGLKTSHYGQMAMRLDTAGNLALMDNAMDKEKGILPALHAVKPGVRWLGTIPKEC